MPISALKAGRWRLYAKDAGFAVQVLDDGLENGEPVELLKTLRQMAKAFGGVQEVAAKAELNPTQLHRTLSNEGKPALTTPGGIEGDGAATPGKRVKASVSAETGFEASSEVSSTASSI